MASIKKPAIPMPPIDSRRGRFDSAIKEHLEIISGLRGSKIKLLDANASNSDVIAKINEILEMLQ